MTTIVITDSPRVVALKREFCNLDAEDVALMATPTPTPEQVERLQAIRQRKVVIATEVLNESETRNSKLETAP